MQMAMQQRSKGARTSTAGALQMQDLVDGTGGIQTHSRRRIEEERGAENDRGGEKRMGKDAATRQSAGNTEIIYRLQSLL